MLSINARMLVAASIVLAAFLGVTGVMLERSFRDSAEAAMRERLRLQLHTLVASMEQDEQRGLVLAYPLYEGRLFAPGSGLYAQIVRNDAGVIWRSPSMDEIDIPPIPGLARGEEHYRYLTTSEGVAVLSYGIGLTWGDDDRDGEGYTFMIAETLERLRDQIDTFRQNLWTALGGVSLVLLITLTLILRWGLAPLRRVEADLADIESGRHLELEGDYPRELKGLTDNLNALLRTSRDHEERYRASLGDLAHSLKTPLAILRAAVEAPEGSADELRATVREQVERMDQIVDYQLQRAAASGRRALATPVDVAAVVGRVVKAMEKVYSAKAVAIEVAVEEGLEFRCDEGDLMELLGNLVDNACKYCRHRVAIEVTGDGRGGLRLEVGDDGPGIADDAVPVVLSRGGRLDTSAQGHGLGLAMIKDMVELYGGRLEFGRSSLGGALVRVHLPAL